MRFPSVFNKKQEKTQDFLEPTKELIQNLFGRADITIDFPKDYQGIPADFSLSSEEQEVLQRVNHIYIDSSDEKTTKYSYENKSKTETPVHGPISLPDPDVEEVLHDVFHRLRIAAGLYRGSIKDDISAGTGEIKS